VAQTATNLEFFRAAVMPGVRVADVVFLERLEARPNLSVEIAGPLPEPFPGPTLILAGRQDNVVGWADTLPLLDSFPRAMLAILDRAGHGLRADQRTLVSALVAEWLDRLEAEPNWPGLRRASGCTGPIRTWLERSRSTGRGPD
jgi:pimeloyl-ACP methyl ester carboxylesterase